jgi:hypothetical protein
MPIRVINAYVIRIFFDFCRNSWPQSGTCVTQWGDRDAYWGVRDGYRAFSLYWGCREKLDTRAVAVHGGGRGILRVPRKACPRRKCYSRCLLNPEGFWWNFSIKASFSDCQCLRAVSFLDFFVLKRQCHFQIFIEKTPKSLPKTCLPSCLWLKIEEIDEKLLLIHYRLNKKLEKSFFQRISTGGYFQILKISWKIGNLIFRFLALNQRNSLKTCLRARCLRWIVT